MKIFPIALTISAGLMLSACEANVTEEGELPSMDVDVSSDAGALPTIEVETADIEVGTDEVEVTVPDVDVKMPGEQ